MPLYSRAETPTNETPVPFVITAIAVVFAITNGSAQQAASDGPYTILKTAKTGGIGGFDYVFADAAGRRLYIPRSGAGARVTVFDLDTLAPVGEIPNASARGATVDPKSGHGFSSSKPVVMWDTKTLTVIKTIDVQGGPDGILFDSFNDRIYIWSHSAPHGTVIDSKTGDVLGTIDLGGAPEQSVTDGKGRIYVDVEDKANVAVIDAKTMTVTAHYDLGGKGEIPAGLAFDVKNKVLFVACRMPAPGVMVMMNADDGKIITTLPLAGASDGAVFNPATMEAFSSHGNGTMSIIKENSPVSFVVEQTLKTMVGAKTLSLDSKTNHIYTMAAEYGAPATPPVAGGRAGRGPMIPDSFTIMRIGK